MHSCSTLVHAPMRASGTTHNARNCFVCTRNPTCTVSFLCSVLSVKIKELCLIIGVSKQRLICDVEGPNSEVLNLPHFILKNWDA